MHDSIDLGTHFAVSNIVLNAGGKAEASASIANGTEVAENLRKSILKVRCLHHAILLRAQICCDCSCTGNFSPATAALFATTAWQNRQTLRNTFASQVRRSLPFQIPPSTLLFLFWWRKFWLHQHKFCYHQQRLTTTR